MPLWLRNRIFPLASKPFSVPLKSHSFYSLLHPFSVIKQFSSVTQSCLTVCHPMDCSMPGFPVLHQFPEHTQTHVHQVGDAIQPSHPHRLLLLPPSVFPSIRVFSNESALCIWWTKYWSFSFSISLSNEYSGLISFRFDWLDLLAVQRLTGVFSNTTVQKPFLPSMKLYFP